MVEAEQSLVPVEGIADVIRVIRGQKVILDADLARLYGVETRVFNQGVKRNLARFPPDFMFQLTKEEYESLRSQNVILKKGRGQHSKYLPYAFTEHGAVMAASILNSPQAVEISVYVVRAFVKFREIISTQQGLSERIDELEARLETRLDTHDAEIGMLIQMIRELMVPLDSESQRRIGYRQPKQDD